MVVRSYWRPGRNENTTHFNVVDKGRDVVFCTHTGVFTAGANPPGPGVYLVVGMGWLIPKLGYANSIAGWKRPLNNMCPTMVFRNGRPASARRCSASCRTWPGRPPGAVGSPPYARVDLRCDDQGRPYVLEVSPNPGLELQARAAGVSYGEVVDAIVKLAVEPHAGAGILLREMAPEDVADLVA